MGLGWLKVSQKNLVSEVGLGLWRVKDLGFRV